MEFRGVELAFSQMVQLCPVPEDERDPDKFLLQAEGILTGSGLENPYEDIENISPDILAAWNQKKKNL
ncbi:hypothetical protein BH23PAT1_BH23PAT1_2280 [soil metagenome]